MKTNIRYLVFILICLFLAGCTMHVKPEKFDFDPQLLKTFKSDVAIRVVVPKNAETKYEIDEIDFSGKQTMPEIEKLLEKRSKNALVYSIDLNDLYNNAKELIEKVLVTANVPLSTSSDKYLKFTICKVQWEKRTFLYMAYLEFDIETGSGYKRHYKVQDLSFSDVSRAIGGTTSRAVEEIFRDEKIIAYIEAR